MQVIKSPNDILIKSRDFRFQSKHIGLVPTMGALHDGHLSLTQRSVQDNDATIVSIFVNPLQFNNPEDLVNYPKTLNADLKLLEDAGVDIVYIPSEEAMYRSKPAVSVDFGPLAGRLEGKYRPGHFRGVGIVVSKLLHHCNPDKAYFGLKDLQQYLLIKKMVEDLSFPVEVIGLPIKRESSGLAMSSRNKRLSPRGIEISSNLYKGLELARTEWERESGPDETKSVAIDFYNKTDGLEIEYFYIVDAESLVDVTGNNSQSVAFCVAGYVEGVRLIDNLYLRQD